MPEQLAQQQPPDFHIDLSGLADAIWQALTGHLPTLGDLIWTGIRDHLPDIGGALLVALEDALRQAAQSIWDAAWGSSVNIVTQLPADLTYDAPWYRAVAVDPVVLAVGGATLAIVLLGLRTIFGTTVGRDSVITHISGRLIPAVFAALAYPVLIVRGVQLLNAAASALGSSAIGGGVVDGLKTTLVLSFLAPPTPVLLLPYLVLWLVLLYYGIRLVIRLAYSLYRFLVALVFGPLAIILWAIPQTEWITTLWLRELLGWGTAPLLVTGALAMAIPLAGGRSGFLAAAVFGIAGLQAAYDLVGLLGHGHSSARLFPFTFATVRAGAAAVSGGGAGVAAASAPAIRPSMLADQYGYQ
jgi:hypothetical protein